MLYYFRKVTPCCGQPMNPTNSKQLSLDTALTWSWKQLLTTTHTLVFTVFPAAPSRTESFYDTMPSLISIHRLVHSRTTWIHRTNFYIEKAICYAWVLFHPVRHQLYGFNRALYIRHTGMSDRHLWFSAIPIPGRLPHVMKSHIGCP